MQTSKSDSRFSWLGWFKKPRNRGVSASPAPVELPKGAKAKVRAVPKSGKNRMQGLAHFQYADISRAFTQAPWRVQVQVFASLAAIAIVIVALGGLYLTEASRAATAGRDVQALQAQKAELEFAIDRQTALIAQAKSVQRLEARAKEIGFVPAETEQIDFMVVAGYYGPQLNLPAEKPPVTQSELPNYDETLGTWLANELSAVFGSGR